MVRQWGYHWWSLWIVGLGQSRTTVYTDIMSDSGIMVQVQVQGVMGKFPKMVGLKGRHIYNFNR